MTNTPFEKIIIPILFFICGLSLRLLWAYETNTPDLDSAVVGLMAMDIQEGARPLFFTGQGYMGALEAYLTAGVFELLGIGSFTFCIIPSLFGAVWPVCLYFLFKCDFSTKAASAAALLAVFPAGEILRYTTLPYGGYPEMISLGTAILLHASLRWHQQKINPWVDAPIFTGFVLVGTWINLQILPFLGTAACIWLYLLWPKRRQPSQWLPFSMVPLACILATLPQILISKGNSVSPPLFSSISLKQVAKSFQALWQYDFQALCIWEGPKQIHDTYLTIPYVLFGLLGILNIYLNRQKPMHKTLWLVGAFLTFFSLLYFPHPMSGYVPRYLIVPFVLIFSIGIAYSFSSPYRILRILSAFILIMWFVFQVSAFRSSIHHLHQKQLESETNNQELIQSARSMHLNPLRFIGSLMEGHSAAAITFQAQNQPVFCSSYDERRRQADLDWHASPNAGYFFTAPYLPYIQGSLSQMGLDPTKIQSTSAFHLMAMPELALSEARAIPITSAQLSSPQTGIEHLHDNDLTTLWPNKPQKASFTLHFKQPIAVSGLRLTAPQDYSLPYKYKIIGHSADGQTHLLSDCHIRIGSSYLSGDRAYFKGYYNQLDVLWSDITLTSLTFSLRPGGRSKYPTQLSGLFLFGPDPEPSSLDLTSLAEWINSKPNARIVASDGLSSLLRRQQLAIPASRLPLPWNPRDPQAQPMQFNLNPEQDWIVLVENRFQNQPDFTSFGPISARYISGHSTSEQLFWQRFFISSQSESPEN